jgi:hypothetical protein
MSSSSDDIKVTDYRSLMKRLDGSLTDSDVEDCFLIGSRNYGLQTSASDYDIILIVKENTKHTIKWRDMNWLGMFVVFRVVVFDSSPFLQYIIVGFLHLYKSKNDSIRMMMTMISIVGKAVSAHSSAQNLFSVGFTLHARLKRCYAIKFLLQLNVYSHNPIVFGNKRSEKNLGNRRYNSFFFFF